MTTDYAFSSAPESACSGACSDVCGPRGCPGPRGPAGPLPPLSDAVDSDSRSTAASSLAVKTVHDRTPALLGADLTLHVRQDGDDAGDGRSETTAKATIAGALRELSRYALGSYATCIRVGAGIFTWPRVERPGFTENTLSVLGAGPDRTLITGTPAVPGSCSLADMSFRETRIDIQSGDQVSFSVDAEHTAVAVRSSRFLVTGRLDLSGTHLECSGTTHLFLQADFGGSIVCDGGTLFRSVDTPEFGVFAQASRGASISFYTCAFEGAATGKKFHIYEGGQISYHGRSTSLQTLLPGDIPGTNSSLAQVAAFGIPCAWAVVRADGTLTAANRVASCTRLSPGRYFLEFFPSLENTAYYSQGMALDTEENISLTLGPGRTGAGCTVACGRNGTATDSAFAISFFLV